MIKKFNKIRKILVDVLLNYLIKKRIDNTFLLRCSIFIYFLLTWNFYTHSHIKARHHFVPQFLLKKFGIKNDGEIGEILEYKTDLKPKRISIEKEACCVSNMYSFRDKHTKKQNDFIETRLFGFLEKYSSRIIERIIIINKIDLTSVERSVLCSFLAIQYTRTPTFLFNLNIFLTYLIKVESVKYEEIKNKNFFRKAFVDDYFKIDIKDVINFHRRNKQIISGANDRILAMSIQIADYISKIIFYKELRLLVASSSEFFFISDNPVVMLNLKNKNFIGPIAQNLKDVLIILPISPTQCLYLTDRGKFRYPPIDYRLCFRLLLLNIDLVAFSDIYRQDVKSFLDERKINLSRSLVF